ncbi:MAG: HlyD family secretion protein [Pseudolabrys sp.]|nr:HlyD family secretion protein [Pseudolabrys sp.]
MTTEVQADIGARACIVRSTDPAKARQRSDAPDLKAVPNVEAPPAAPSLAIPPAKPGRSFRPSLRTALMAAGVIAVAAGSLVFWLEGGRYATTDDANVAAAKVLVTTDVSGLVSSVKVHEGQNVKAGQVLFAIDPLQFQIALDSARANLSQVALNISSMKETYKELLSNVDSQKAQVALDVVTNERNANLVANNDVPRQIYDQSRYTLQLDQARLKSLEHQAAVQLATLGGNPDIRVEDHPLYRQARAAVDEAQRQLDHATVRAPFDGIVTQVDALQPGTYLVSQTAALTATGAVALVSASDVWVDAQMKETELTYVKPGDRVDVTIDTYPGVTFKGTVESVSPASGSEFSILPAQNSSGNFVKVVQRIPVKIAIDRTAGAPALRAGMSAYVSIDTGHRRSLSDLF